MGGGSDGDSRDTASQPIPFPHTRQNAARRVGITTPTVGRRDCLPLIDRSSLRQPPLRSSRSRRRFETKQSPLTAPGADQPRRELQRRPSRWYSERSGVSAGNAPRYVQTESFPSYPVMPFVRRLRARTRAQHRRFRSTDGFVSSCRSCPPRRVRQQPPVRPRDGVNAAGKGFH